MMSRHCSAVTNGFLKKLPTLPISAGSGSLARRMAQIQSKTEAVKKKSGCSAVAYDVEVKEGRVVLKSKPVNAAGITTIPLAVGNQWVYEAVQHPDADAKKAMEGKLMPFQAEKVVIDAALKGLNAMPPKGGNMSLSDAEVTAAVDYMVSAAK